MEIPSKKLNEAVEALSQLPGVGKRTALRYAFYLLRLGNESITELSEKISGLKELKKCNRCFNLCEQDVCDICANTRRNQHIICVVENVRDLYAIENTLQFTGVYHVLEGLISPMEGLGPFDINVQPLLERVEKEETKEVILALSSTVEAETTNFFIFKKLKERNVTVTNLARGISFGDDLEYADEISLGRSLMNRIPYNAEVR
ncbi:MAG TPA: recombination mediator RecR [Flavobacteriales bacterium]|nr:recombination mediator RecR [Flavobacteriales bacterium]